MHNLASARNELTPTERREVLPKVATNKWHSALSMFPGVWVPQMAAFPVNDPMRPQERFGVVLDLDFHHDSALTRVFFSAEGTPVRSEFKATPAINARRAELDLPESEPERILLADNIIRALSADNENAHSDAANVRIIDNK